MCTFISLRRPHMPTMRGPFIITATKKSPLKDSGNEEVTGGNGTWNGNQRISIFGTCSRVPTRKRIYKYKCNFHRYSWLLHIFYHVIRIPPRSAVSQISLTRHFPFLGKQVLLMWMTFHVFECFSSPFLCLFIKGIFISEQSDIFLLDFSA